MPPHPTAARFAPAVDLPLRGRYSTCAAEGIGNRAGEQRCCGAPAVIGGSMEVRKNLRISKDRCDFVAHQIFIELIERSALEHVAEPVETQGHAADCTDAERRAPADARLVQRDLCRRRGEGEIAA